MGQHPSTFEDDHILKMIQDASQRDRAYRILMSKYQEAMYQHIRRMVNTHEDAADVLQNVWIKILRAIPAFKGESSLYTWMYRICTNEALTHLRKVKRQRVHVVEEVEESSLRTKAVTEDVNSEQIKHLLQKAIKQLPEKQKLVFSLRYFEEMSYKDMSAVLETSVGGLKASYHHAVKKIESFVKASNKF